MEGRGGGGEGGRLTKRLLSTASMLCLDGMMPHSLPVPGSYKEKCRFAGLKASIVPEMSSSHQ